MRITLFSKTDCERCEQAKFLLLSNGYVFDEVRADRESAKVMRDNNIKGFPALFVDDEFKGDGVMAVVNFMKEQKAHPWS